MQIEEAIAIALRRNITEVDSKVFYAIVSDLAPECVKERKMLRAAITDKVLSLIVHDSLELSETTKAKIRYILAEEQGLSTS